jgi:hypothetical protein
VAKFRVKEIQEAALKIVQEHPGGIRYSELVKAISGVTPETPINTIHGAVWDLDKTHPQKISKPSRGLFKYSDPAQEGDVSAPSVALPPAITKYKEEDFYAPFAEWLKNDLDEATIAVPIGGAGFQKKWGTPDVIGVYKPLASHRIKFDLELLAAEIKIDPFQPVVAFGQAAAYRLFSAKSYVVMPDTISEEDYSRLEALCMIYGIGLVLFKLDPADPDFTIRVRAQRFLPDMFYVNEFADRLYQLDPSVFNQLFG